MSQQENQLAAKLVAVLLPLLVIMTLSTFYFAMENRKKAEALAAWSTPVEPATAEAEARRSPKKPRAIFERRRRTPEAATHPKFIEYDAVCSLCKGTGELELETGRDQTTSYPCPVCGAKGTNYLSIPYGSELCEVCKGLGKLPQPRDEGMGQQFLARLCVRCNGKGWHR